MLINPFSTHAPLLYPLKTSENRRFSDLFRGYRSGTWVENGLMKLCKDFRKGWYVTTNVTPLFFLPFHPINVGKLNHFHFVLN